MVAKYRSIITYVASLDLKNLQFMVQLRGYLSSRTSSSENRIKLDDWASVVSRVILQIMEEIVHWLQIVDCTREWTFGHEPRTIPNQNIVDQWVQWVAYSPRWHRRGWPELKVDVPMMILHTKGRWPQKYMFSRTLGSVILFDTTYKLWNIATGVAPRLWPLWLW